MVQVGGCELVLVLVDFAQVYVLYVLEHVAVLIMGTGFGEGGVTNARGFYHFSTV